ncbi:NAD(P)-dependent oxidoreductase [Homoserinibacter sp. GY 40078]|uniref:NAD(P)-dependent oxidoreductase n=1 Tax=Homoserinibacter sp. GY 40078 TaxID=2603275 RepID=UPI0011C845DC|nr:NAD(P)-dependent oxidoreductase [Homoserinibacter sp. GY 40078]TXK16413.1 NAD(P)-dependent oxidoreductase [Homoserinibacter sp. GY 40078]
MNVGFAGIGIMGAPMAGRLVDAGVPLTVWSRSPEACDELVARGADRASDPDALFARCDTVILMLRDDVATDEVLGRGTEAFARRIAGHRIVVMGTHTPAYSLALESDIRAAGGHYVEAPVSGSRVPAEQGKLVLLLAGADEAVLGEVGELLAPLGVAAVPCGAVPGALRTKIAVNHYMMAMVAALAEAVTTARATGVDLDAMLRVLEASPMDSPIGRVKGAKLVARDEVPQAAISDVVKNCGFVLEAARAAGATTPIIDLVAELYGRTADAGFADADMVAVARVLGGR